MKHHTTAQSILLASLCVALSGLAAAHYRRQHAPQAKCLVLENHSSSAAKENRTDSSSMAAG